MSSIRRRLLVALLAAMAAVMLLGAMATYRVAEGEADAFFDEQLRQIGLSMRDHLFLGAPAAPIDEAEQMDFAIQVWSPDGETLYYSHPHRALPDRARLGLATVSTPDGAWRIFALQQRGQTIQVAQPMDVRRSRAAAMALRTLIPFLVSLPALGLMIWIIVGRGLRPLARIAESVRVRTPASLDPLDDHEVPREVRTLVTALNDLLARLRTALDAQRAFVADAAHELRTPLAALQLQAQLAERARDEPDRSAAMTELKAGLQRATHAVNQLLTLARSEFGKPVPGHAGVDLSALAVEVIGEHVPLAASKAIDLGLEEASNEASVAGDVDALRVLMANLIGNAIRYTPCGGRIDVRVAAVGDRLAFEVADSGPGIPAQDRQRVFERFYRGPDAEGAGTGLGLAIVKAIAESHAGDIFLGEAAAGGLLARVSFPTGAARPAAAAATGSTAGAGGATPRHAWRRGGEIVGAGL